MGREDKMIKEYEILTSSYPRKVGTAHFKDMEAAVKYFRGYFPPGENEYTMKSFVDQKMALGEVKLGPPPSLPGWRVLLWNNCRYYMEETIIRKDGGAR
jgi:hypothetical protein